MNKVQEKHQTEKANWKELEVPLKKKETSRLLEQVVGWQLANSSITKNFKFNDFKQAVKFVHAVAEIAEKENHHPEILLWKMSNVKLTLKTYCINDLSKLDFSLAKKIDKIDWLDSQNGDHTVKRKHYFTL